MAPSCFQSGHILSACLFWKHYLQQGFTGKSPKHEPCYQCASCLLQGYLWTLITFHHEWSNEKEIMLGFAKNIMMKLESLQTCSEDQVAFDLITATFESDLKIKASTRKWMQDCSRQSFNLYIIFEVASCEVAG
jgi:hypothetical protein